MPVREMMLELTVLLCYFRSLALLFARVAVSYGFYEPALLKWSSIEKTSMWFGTLGIPLPGFMAFLTATAEIMGVLLLFLGLFTRLVSVPLMIVMITAVVAVHMDKGFNAANGGFEIPLYYFIFLLIFSSFGAGRFSLDHIFFGEEK